MNRISATLVLSVVALAASQPAAHGQTPPNWCKSRTASKPAQPTPNSIHDESVQLAAMTARTVTVPSAGTSGPTMQMVNSRNVVIDFELKGVGESGLGEVELWYTLNGQTWFKYSGGVQTQSPFVVEVAQDGLYGFTVVARNGMGIGKTPPQPGDAPQVWVDVDTTRPVVRLLNTQTGADENGRTLTLRWSATDRNLVSRPITLSYAEQSQGPWFPFATNLENSGEYTWHMSAGLPKQVLVRVEATDRIGNCGEDRMTLPAPVDLARPTAMIRNVSRNGVIMQVGGQR
jgi:hypothetical protein